jgi:predicted amidophosphoribosyltransferase
MSIVCPNCNADLPDDAVFCDQCGASLGSAPQSTPAAPAAAAGENVCPSCGASTIPGEAFCDNCGASLAEPAVAAPEPAPTAAPAEAAPAPADTDLVICPSCGAENLPNSAFCSNCGLSMELPVPAEELEETEIVEYEEPKEELPAVVEGAEEVIEAEIEEIEEEEVEAPAAAPIDETDAPPPTGQPRFVVRDTGAEIPLPAGEGDFIIGREDPVSNVFPAIDLNPHEGENYGVSRRHAKLTVEAGMAFIEDLDSTNFTFVNRKKLVPNTPTALSNGDEVRLGKLVMTYLE